MPKSELPDATSLVLAFDAGGGPSPGTAKTGVEGLGKGGRTRINGELQRVPLAWKTRTFERDGNTRFAMTIPWGDVYTAFVSTGIPNIQVYLGVPPVTAQALRRLRWAAPVRGIAFARRQYGLQHRIDQSRVDRTGIDGIDRGDPAQGLAGTLGDLANALEMGARAIAQRLDQRVEAQVFEVHGGESPRLEIDEDLARHRALGGLHAVLDAQPGVGVLNRNAGDAHMTQPEDRAGAAARDSQRGRCAIP